MRNSSPIWRFSQALAAASVLAVCVACQPAGPGQPDADPAAGSQAGAETPSAGSTETGSASAAAGAPHFRDASESSGLDFHHFNGMTGEMYFSEMVGPGAALFDYDADGDLDLFIVQGSPLKPGDDPMQSIRPPRHPLPLQDRLYRNDLSVAGARFVDVTDESAIDSRGYGMGVASGDIDNDGYPDLYIANFGDNELWRNRGDGTFENITERAGAGEARWSVSTVFLDIDRDGWLDLFIGNYVEYSIGSHKRCRAATGAIDYCGPHSYKPETDRLLRNRGDGTFEDVSSRFGLDSAAGGALGVVDADFDLDGWPDLYVANDGVANHLWTRKGEAGSADEALLRGAALNRDGNAEAGMGVDAGDVDNDGDEDIFLSHLTQETNTLYINFGNATFDDSTSVRGLGTPSWEGTGFGTGFIDIDNDSWLDVVVLNGAVKVIEQQRGEDFPLHQRNQLYRNLGDGVFEELDGGPAFEPSEVSRGLAIGDVDNDGGQDMVVLNNAGPARLLLNQRHSDNHFLGLQLLTRTEPSAAWRDALGAWVELRRAGQPTLYRRARTGGSYASARDPRVHFGLGDWDGPGEQHAAASLRITWPDGSREVFELEQFDRYVTLRQGEGRGAGLGAGQDTTEGAAP